jgi:hypothetical protein
MVEGKEVLYEGRKEKNEETNKQKEEGNNDVNTEALLEQYFSSFA